jgi:hypothetical protein
MPTFGRVSKELCSMAFQRTDFQWLSLDKKEPNKPKIAHRNVQRSGLFPTQNEILSQFAEIRPIIHRTICGQYP